MKRLLAPALLLILVAACAPKTKNTLPQVPIRTYNAPQASAPIVVDGILDEADWEAAPLSDAFGVRDADFPLCVIDITGKVAADCRYAVTVQDIQDYEAKYGPIPDGAFVALRTDWYKKWRDMDALSGVDEDSATQMMAEVGVDLRLFITAAMLVGWAGLKPRNDESNGKFKSKKTTHGNKYLRKLLIECAWGASRTKGCFYNKFSYHQTQVRKKKGKKVQVAIARKMLVAIWFILTTGCQYKDYVREVEQKTEEARDIASEAVRKAIKPKAGKKERQDAGQQPQS